MVQLDFVIFRLEKLLRSELNFVSKEHFFCVLRNPPKSFFFYIKFNFLIKNKTHIHNNYHKIKDYLHAANLICKSFVVNLLCLHRLFNMF